MMAEIEVKRKVIPGDIDVHPTDSAIVVNYLVQATILNENGQAVVGDKKALQKIIRIKSLHSGSNLQALAQEVVEKCKLIHPSKVRDVEQLLYYLQQRHGGSNGQERDSWVRKQLEDARRLENYQNQEGQEEELASLDRIEQYIEGLYEEIPEKVVSTRNILQLARIPENMDILISNDALISALSRVLREDGKRSMELVTNIMYTFFCFSNFSQYHNFITQNKIGDMCLRITDQELTRFNLWVQDLQKLESKEIPPREREQEHRKFQAMIRKQDQLLFVSFHLLLNLAEDLNIEVKMIKRDIIKYLMIMLDRKTVELLILAVTFLKKLSIFRENKDEMVKNSDVLISKLGRLVPCDHQGLQNLTLRLLLNLSHDPQFRAALAKNGFAQKLVDVLHHKNHIVLSLQLLYMLSIDEKIKSMFSQTDLMPLVMRMILEYKGERVNLELMSLAINLGAHPRIAEIICEDNGLKFLMKRALKTRDPLILKMIRNISHHDGVQMKMLFLDYIDELMHILLKSSSPEITVEVLGILANLTIPDFDFAKLAEAYGLLGWISRRLSQGCADLRGSNPNASRMSAQQQQNEGIRGGIAEDDDILLETISWLGTMANDENIPRMVASTNIIFLLMDLMIGKEEDDEMILQIIYAIYQFLLDPTSRNMLITQTQVVSYLIDLLYDRNVEIRKMCDVCLDLIAEIDEDWVKKIRQQKFQWHNSEWLQVLAQNHTGNNDQDDEEEEEEGSDSNSPYESTILYSDRPMTRAGHYRYPSSEQEDSEDEDRFGIGGSSAILDGP
ncbi:kinesin-associated protein-domain-containing protein [Cladochytrium replicatum]|nr:kinesin-associated protein-domain-containing protein [Cladochytrium replicatum]